MNQYKTTIAVYKPEYLNRKLLLSNVSKDGLFRLDDGSYIQIEVNTQGELFVHKIKKGSPYPLNMSLRKIGETFLQLRDPSVNQMLKYFVLPVMEVERIFNNARYKYLNAIYLSKFLKPYKLMNAKCNKAFQALAGLNIYQGNKKDRKENDLFWQEAGFKSLLNYS